MKKISLIKRLKGAFSVLIGKSEAIKIYKPVFKPEEKPVITPKPRYWSL